MNKKINLSISILCILEIICCFTPFCLVEECWKYLPSLTYHGRSSLVGHDDISIWGNEAALGKPLAILFVCAAILVTVVYFMKTLDYTAKFTNKAWLFAIAHTATMVIFLVYSCRFAKVEEISYKYKYGINWMSYIIIALNIIILILSILLKMDKVPTKKQMFVNAQKETVEDLMTYKELLDSGAISKDEFDAKKKQILKL